MPRSRPHLPLPETLQDWRFSGWEPRGTVPRDLWNSLEPFFLNQGLALWKTETKGSVNVVPPNDHPRCPDAFAYTTKYVDQYDPEPPRFIHEKAIHCPARTRDNRDVLIRLIAKGDQGLNHLTALRRLASGPSASRGENHAVVVLQEIAHEDMVFMTFPLMSTGFAHPWFFNFSEILDAVDQVLEGVTFSHKHLVAHLDLAVDNILINFSRGPSQTPEGSIGLFPSPFRQYFPIRYYINDFELAACFEDGSDPATHLVSGLPITGIIKKGYGRKPAPEMLTKAPYSPFRADVWQLGRMFNDCFGHLEKHSQPLADLFSEMMDTDPLSRPTAPEALDRLRHLRATLSSTILEHRVPRPPYYKSSSMGDRI